MKRRSIVGAYENVRPDDEAKQRMLNNILGSSEISHAGKDERKMRKKMKPLVIAAMISLMIFLMGCAIVVMTLQDLKIGERVTGSGEILDSDGNIVKETEFIQEVLSLHGLVNTPTYLAHQEWFEFYEEYDSNHEITEEENFFVPPEAYQAYFVYNQELIDKVDEIANKYNLKLLGACSYFQRWESDVFHEATGVKTYLVSDSVATIGDESGYFYQEGNFKVEFDMILPDSGDYWPYTVSASLYYSEMDNFDTIGFHINDSKNIEQWNYTTASGDDLLIINSESGKYALIYCINPDSVIYVRVGTGYEDEQGEITLMTKAQIEQIAAQLDYAIKVETVNLDLAKANLEQYRNINGQEESDRAYSRFDDFIRDGLEKLGDRVDDYYYHLIDLTGDDGFEELIIGTKDVITYVWMLDEGNQMKLIMDVGENYQKLKETWPTMEKKPITEYFSE